ncbi:MAG: putative quinol monooxygenase [Pseudomonadota bacterium]
MIIVEGYVRLADPADLDRVRTAAEAQITASRAEADNLDYTYAVDLNDPAVMRVLERWQSWDALEAHFKEPHMTVWRDALADIKFEERVIRAHHVSETRDL